MREVLGDRMRKDEAYSRYPKDPTLQQAKE